MGFRGVSGGAVACMWKLWRLIMIMLLVCSSVNLCIGWLPIRRGEVDWMVRMR